MHKLGQRGVARGALGLITVAVAALVSSYVCIAAEPTSLEGSWSGGGKVRFPSGDIESARCRANFKKRGGSSFSMVAVCATASSRIEQTAVLAPIAPNRFSGEFQNSEFGISGLINITVSGNSLSASLSGGGGSAHFRLGR